MKKYIIAFFFILTSLNVMAEEVILDPEPEGDEKKIPQRERSVSFIPTAFFEPSTGILSVEFPTADSIAVEVCHNGIYLTTGYGNPVYLMLPVEAGEYTIRVIVGDVVFYGMLNQ